MMMIDILDIRGKQADTDLQIRSALKSLWSDDAGIGMAIGEDLSGGFAAFAALPVQPWRQDRKGIRHRREILRPASRRRQRLRQILLRRQGLLIHPLARLTGCFQGIENLSRQIALRRSRNKSMKDGLVERADETLKILISVHGGSP
jgi:hypothetical protein